MVTADIRSQLLKAGAALTGIPASAYIGLQSGKTYYAYDPTTASYWAGAELMPSLSSLPAIVSVQDGGSYILFHRPAGKAWVAEYVGLAGADDSPCPRLVPAAVLTLWNWRTLSCRPAVL